MRVCKPHKSDQLHFSHLADRSPVEIEPHIEQIK